MGDFTDVKGHHNLIPLVHIKGNEMNHKSFAASTESLKANRRTNNRTFSVHSPQSAQTKIYISAK